MKDCCKRCEVEEANEREALHKRGAERGNNGKSGWEMHCEERAKQSVCEEKEAGRVERGTGSDGEVKRLSCRVVRRRAVVAERVHELFVVERGGVARGAIGGRVARPGGVDGRR